MKYFQGKTALSPRMMERFVEEATEKETESEQIQSILESVAWYMICDFWNSVATLAEGGILQDIVDVCEYFHSLVAEP